jgi:DNA-directed RNA polymerase subunit RPC12/RpoP
VIQATFVSRCGVIRALDPSTEGGVSFSTAYRGTAAGTSSEVPMKDPLPYPRPRTPRAQYRPGTYIGCSACGRLIKIEWAVRSLICSCGARVAVKPASGS